MAYDFHSYVWYLPVTGHNAPLFSNEHDKGLFSTLNTNWSANYWHELGMPRRKIQIGIPTYAHTFRYKNNLSKSILKTLKCSYFFRLVNPDNNGLNAPAIGYGSVGSKGFAYYSDVCNFTSLQNTGVKWDNESKVPYAFNNYDWISYDNATSVEYKVRMQRPQGKCA
jgi:chitinase